MTELPTDANGGKLYTIADGDGEPAAYACGPGGRFLCTSKEVRTREDAVRVCLEHYDRAVAAERSRHEAREAALREALDQALDGKVFPTTHGDHAWTELQWSRNRLVKKLAASEAREAELRGEVERLTGALRTAKADAMREAADWLIRCVDTSGAPKDMKPWERWAMEAAEGVLELAAPELPSAAEEPRHERCGWDACSRCPPEAEPPDVPEPTDGLSMVAAGIATLRGELEETRRVRDALENRLDVERRAHEETRRERDDAIQHFQEEFDGHHRSRKKLGEAIAAERAARKEAERVRDEQRSFADECVAERNTFAIRLCDAKAEVVRLREALENAHLFAAAHATSLVESQQGPWRELFRRLDAILAAPTQTTDPSETTETPT